MRVIYVVTRGDAVGGAQIHVRDLATASRAAGDDVLVVCGTSGQLTEQLEAVGIPLQVEPSLVRAIHPVKDVSAVKSLIDITRIFKPDLVSLHSSKAGIVGRVAARRTGVPTIFTAHGFAFTSGVPEPNRTIYRLIERTLASSAAAIICVSENDRQIAIKAGLGEHRLHTIHNGMIDADPALRARPDDGEPIRVVMTARFDRQKDHETLFRAMATVPNVEVDLIGGGPDLESRRALADHLGLRNRVHFLGQRSDVVEILARAHIFVLSSNWEGFPRSTLEAMRAGLPVVVSDVGGSAEAVTEGVTGFVVPPGDPEVLAERLRKLTQDPALRRSMGAAGRARFEAEFEFRIMFDRTRALQQKVAQGTA